MKLLTLAVFLSMAMTVDAPSLTAGELGVEFDDAGWVVRYDEDFDGTHEAVDGQTFGTADWLTFELVNGGRITISDGYALINTVDFQDVALIRSTATLPARYKVRVRIGFINYDLTEYEPEDLVHPDFNTHQGAYENGVYFLTVTDNLCEGTECAENWWHYHRKMVVDVDNHVRLPAGDTVQHPVYMVYMAPEINEGGNLLRTWTGSFWDTSPWNWNSAYTYDGDTWYYAELEKSADYLILRLYDQDGELLQETSPADLDLVFAMDDPTEYLFVGEPHSDDYEGNARIDRMTLLVPQADCCVGRVGDANGSGGEEPTIGDISVMIDAKFISVSCDGLIDCPAEADVNQSGGVVPACEDITIGDISVLIDYLFISLPQGFGPLPDCP